MSSIKLKHSGGNGVSIAPPDTNPASDKTVKLPATNGTLLTTDSSPSFRNLFNNGACRIGQRPSTSLTSGYGGVDRWYQYLSGGVTTTSKDTDVPTGQGFSNSIKLDVTTLLASGSSNWAWVGQYIEAQDVQSVCKGTSNAKQLTLQFWVKSPKTGTHTVRLDCQDSSDGVGATYSVSAADTWEKKTVTFPASTSGAITNDNGRGIQVLWVLSAGTNYSSGTLNTTWASWTNANAAPGQPNVLDSGSNNFYLTGVQLEIGDVATPFEHRSYNDELVQCERYYQTTYHGSTQDSPRMDLGFAASDTQIQSVHHYRTIMRDTLTPTQSGAFRVDGNTTKDVTSITFTYVSNVSAQVNYFTGAGLGGNNPYIIRGHSDADARLNFDAEL